jgi:hypothetical protein
MKWVAVYVMITTTMMDKVDFTGPKGWVEGVCWIGCILPGFGFLSALLLPSNFGYQSVFLLLYFDFANTIG